jgi:hypothetical protein
MDRLSALEVVAVKDIGKTPKIWTMAAAPDDPV